jgi:DNA ligase-1
MDMTLTERCKYFTEIFDLLQATNSPIVKRAIIDDIVPECKEDFEYIIEVLTGNHVYGYSYWLSDVNIGHGLEEWSVKDVLQYLQGPQRQRDWTIENITKYVRTTSPWGWFIEPIVNRRLKLGIGKSILPKDGLGPMLAKKYEGKIKRDSAGYVITEKLDGNRCIASYELGEWVFRSRNGKRMHVNFNMGDLPKELVYDGEIMSRAQTNASINLHRQISNNTQIVVYKNEFNATSGLINRHSLDKDLVYNIFDLMIDDVPYIDRRIELNKIETSYAFGDDIRILPVLNTANYNTIEAISSHLLHLVTDMGGEGCMINLGSGMYNHKRTDELLKLKKVQTIDMKVVDFDWGNGKYEGMIGALKAECVTDDGKIIKCDIGSGMSDDQRFQWALDFGKIEGKIIEVAYFSLSQTSAQKGSNYYSLRFPRLKSVRKDKVETSEY